MSQASLVFVLFQLSEFTLCFRYRGGGLAVRKLDIVNLFFCLLLGLSLSYVIHLAMATA